MRRETRLKPERATWWEQGAILAGLLVLVGLVVAVGSAFWLQNRVRSVDGTIQAIWYRTDPRKGPRQTILQVRLRDGRLVTAESDFLYPGFNGDRVRLTEFSTWAGYRSYRIAMPADAR